MVKKNSTYKGYSRHVVKKSIILLGFACDLCASTKNIHTHHKNENPKDNPEDGSNWQRLCRSCHMKLHWKPRKKFANRKEGLIFHANLCRKRERDKFRLSVYKALGTYDFLRTKDICQEMNLTRERIRQLRDKGFLNFVKLSNRLFIYPHNYRKI